MSPPRSHHIRALADRIQDLEIENRPAEWMCDYYAANPNITWYLDPPYPTAAPKSGLYTHNLLDTEEWIPRLKSIQGLAAISGYGDEWGELEAAGWWRNEHATVSVAGAQHGRPRSKRTEVLWTNYDPAEYSDEGTQLGLVSV